jgi:glycosyltransferase involved in cell wall biosynthesis
MNVLIYAPQMAAFGGMERHVCGLASLLAARGHRVTLLTTSNSLAAELREPLLQHGVELRELARGRGAAGRITKGLWLLREALRNEAISWDLIYTNGQSALARFAWFAARSHTRIVHHHHTAADAAEQRTWSRSFRRVLQTAPELVGCSRATQASLGAVLGRDDVRFLPYLTRSVLDAGGVQDRSYNVDTALHFGFMGRLVAEKGIAHICELSRRPELANITWHIHGAGSQFPPEYFQPYPKIVYHGAYTSAVEQASILRKLDALVLLSTHNEGMPLSLLEAMSAGLPWIATDRGGTREMALAPQNCVVVDFPFTSASLVSAVAEMAARIRAGTTSRQAQRSAYDRHFSPPVVGNAWCSYFETRDLALKSA